MMRRGETQTGYSGPMTPLPASDFLSPFRALLVAGAMAVLLTACTSPVPRTENEWRPSPNFDSRRANLVVIHHTSDETAEEALRTLTNPERRVSAHYLIGRDGRIFQLVDEGNRAWHAGQSWWNGQSDVNSASIGIELDNTGHEPFPDAQIDALLALLGQIKERNNIPTANFVGHADVAPGRKVDPSAYFPWARLAENGFGLWCKPPYPVAPAGFDTALALAAIGYDASLPATSEQAFMLHFMRDGSSEAGSRDPEETMKDLLFCLLRQKAALGPN